MNKRIKELAVRAGIEFTYDPTEVPIRAFIEAWEGDLEKFAELIVRECAGINLKSPFQDGEFHAREVLEHFGVE
jgi:hypothetical protein